MAILIENVTEIVNPYLRSGIIISKYLEVLHSLCMNRGSVCMHPVKMLYTPLNALGHNFLTAIVTPEAFNRTDNQT